MKHAEEKNNSGESFGLRDTLVWCGIPIIVVLLIRVFLIGFYVIPSESMTKDRASRSPSMAWRLTKAHTFAQAWTPAHSRSA